MTREEMEAELLTMRSTLTHLIIVVQKMQKRVNDLQNIPCNQPSTAKMGLLEPPF